MITPGNENLIHHWTITECSREFETEYLAKKGMPEPGPCYPFHKSQPKTEWPEVSKYCTTVSFVWAVGSPLVQDFPEDIAYPSGGADGDYTYFYLQLHYDNPNLIDGIKDQSGVRYYASTKYRPIELGIFVRCHANVVVHYGSA